ncbi:MAG: ArdC family protein [Planctomycetota bacterium]
MKGNYAKGLIDQALERLTVALAQGRSEALTAYLSAMARFSSYSAGNLLLILAQRPEAARIAGYRTWQELGRYVKKGEKGIVIVAPIVFRKRCGDAQPRAPPSDETERSLRGFKLVYVFDVSQTEGKPLPEPARVGGNPNGHTEKLKAFVAASGITLEYSNALGTADGVSCGGKITLREGLSPAEEFSVMVYEFAHATLHRGENGVRLSKTVRETEAEAVAFVVGQAIGLDTAAAASDYIQIYCGDKNTIAESLDRIQRTASPILEAITKGS